MLAGSVSLNLFPESRHPEKHLLWYGGTLSSHPDMLRRYMGTSKRKGGTRNPEEMYSTYKVFLGAGDAHLDVGIAQSITAHAFNETTLIRGISESRERIFSPLQHHGLRLIRPDARRRQRRFAVFRG